MKGAVEWNNAELVLIPSGAVVQVANPQKLLDDGLGAGLIGVTTNQLNEHVPAGFIRVLQPLGTPEDQQQALHSWVYDDGMRGVVVKPRIRLIRNQNGSSEPTYSSLVE